MSGSGAHENSSLKVGVRSSIVMKAILLAGGKGTRLRPLTVHTPKPIVPIFNRPFLYYQIDQLRQVPEIDEAILSLNYQPRRIEEIFGDGEGLGMKLRYVVEPMPLGTAGAVRYAGDSLTESVVVFNGDVLTQVDLRAVLALHRERKAKATIVLTPVDNPRAYGLVETDAQGNVQRFLEKPGEDEITCNTINAGIYILEPDTFDRIPKDTSWSIERSFFPSLIERGETFVAYVYDGYWIDIGTPAKYLQVHRDIMDGLYSAPPSVGGRRPESVDLSGRAPRGGRRSARPLLRRRGRGHQGRNQGASLLGHRAADARRRGGGDRRVDHLAERVDRTRSDCPRLDPRAQLPRRPQRDARNAGRFWATRPSSPTTAGSDRMPINPNIFKAYDVRGLYPSEIDEDAARLIGRAFVSYLSAKRIAVGRDMRLSSPSVAAAFIAGAREQGANVVDYGMIATDMMYSPSRATATTAACRSRPRTTRSSTTGSRWSGARRFP